MQLKEILNAYSAVAGGGIELIPYNRSTTRASNQCIFRPIKYVKLDTRLSEFCNILWHLGFQQSSIERPKSNWSGFIETSTSCMVKKFSKCGVDFLPIINMNPSDETCIYSTLWFVIDQASKMKIPTPVITFDQPLWTKAMSTNQKTYT